LNCDLDFEEAQKIGDRIKCDECGFRFQLNVWQSKLEKEKED